jgi:hypothetical protein
VGVFAADSRKPSYVAGQIAKWTKMIPQSIPFKRTLPVMKPQLETLPILPRVNLTYLCEWISRSGGEEEHSMKVLDSYRNLFGLCQRGHSDYLTVSLPLPAPNIEPFLGSISDYRSWDAGIFLLSGLYFFAKIVYLIFRYFRP